MHKALISFRMFFCVVFHLLILVTVNVAAASSALILPSEQEAIGALLVMWEAPEYSDKTYVELSTCKAVADAEHAGKIVCAVGVRVGELSSATFMEFYRSGSTWVAQPSAS
jgi:hypothetical protein